MSYFLDEIDQIEGEIWHLEQLWERMSIEWNDKVKMRFEQNYWLEYLKDLKNLKNLIIDLENELERIESNKR